MTAAVLGTGYGQDFFDSPAAKVPGPSTVFVSGYKPVELKTQATKQFQADLKKYANFTGVPDFGVYGGYVLADFAIVSLANRTTIPATSCGYYLQAKGGKFVPFPRSGKPITGELVGSHEALAAAKSGTGPTTTTAPPAQ
jgi:hypothetical protein